MYIVGGILHQQLRLTADDAAALVDLLEREPGAVHFGRGERRIDPADWLDIPIFTGFSARLRIGKDEATPRAPHASPVRSTIRRWTRRAEDGAVLSMIASRQIFLFERRIAFADCDRIGNLFWRLALW
jgi:hypothetical protein